MRPRRDSGSGITAAAQRVVAHARSLVGLQRELARAELQRKGATIGAGAAPAIGAAILAVFAVGFGLAALAGALALLVDWWPALLIVFSLLLAAVAGLALGARRLVQEGTPLEPEQALEEAQRTKDLLRGGHDG